LPEPTSSQESPRHLSNEIGVADEVLAQSATSIGVVAAVSQLHGTTTSEAAATFITATPGVGAVTVSVL
jgi:Cu/Ag efflux protein CusF